MMNKYKLPTFFVVGAQKSGTTSLHNYLCGHPDIFLPFQKETKFFVKDELYKKGLEYYEKTFFSEYSGEKAVGEIDPDIIYFNKALERIKNSNIVPKFIFIFRHPVDRAFSHYLMTYRRGRESLSFSNAVAEEKERINKGDYENMEYSYISRGFYARQLDRFILEYSPSSMLFLLSEDLQNNTQATIKKCLDFLGVDSAWVPDNVNQVFHKANVPKNVALYKTVRYQSPLRNFARLLVPGKKMRKIIREAIFSWNTTDTIRQKMTDETRQYLIDIYREENIRLGELIGRDLSHWNK
ncbi:MAG: sulfotransferase, partial [Methylococcales bacterium]